MRRKKVFVAGAAPHLILSADLTALIYHNIGSRSHELLLLLSAVSLPPSSIWNEEFHDDMLARDLAELYGVETKRLKEAVQRNIQRFPEDFMFEMTFEELKNWRT